MIDSDKYVTYHQAMELKKLGFNGRCYTFYDSQNQLIPNYKKSAWLTSEYIDAEDLHISHADEWSHIEGLPDAPTFDEAHEWFRSQGLYITIWPEEKSGNFCYKIYVIGGPGYFVRYSDKQFTYDEIYRLAISHCIRILKNRLEERPKIFHYTDPVD